jgi:hypothetical protein
MHRRLHHNTLFSKVTFDLPFHHFTYVLLDGLAIPFMTYYFQVVIPDRYVAALAEHDYTAFLSLETLINETDNTLLTAQVERELGDKASLNVSNCDTRANCHETGLPTHDFDETYTVLVAMGFHIGALDGFLGLFDGSLESEASIDNWNIVGYRLRNCKGRNRYLSTFNLLIKHSASL